MPTIQGTEIQNLINLFNNRGVKFYHACQLKDFQTYIQLGGVPSRNLMEQSGFPYTPFDTDNTDRHNAVWNKVFGNLQDFGFGFAQGATHQNTAPTPNPYGPILLIFRPEVFLEATDVAICLRSAGGTDFNRENEALATVELVNRIFEHEDIDQSPNDYAKAYIKYARALQERFNDQSAQTPEVSFIVGNERLSFAQVEKIVVDPYVINNINLRDRVNELRRQNNIGGVVWRRLYRNGEQRMEMKQELANLLLQHFVSVPDIINNQANSENLRGYATRLQNGNMTFFYNRFAKYLRSGTLIEMNGGEPNNNQQVNAAPENNDDLPF